MKHRILFDSQMNFSINNPQINDIGLVLVKREPQVDYKLIKNCNKKALKLFLFRNYTLGLVIGQPKKRV